MKRFLVITILLIVSILVCIDKAFNPVLAEDLDHNELTINTLYPNNILEYQDLSTIEFVTINDNYIAYNTTKSELIIFDKTSKKYFTSSEFNNIFKIKYVAHNQLIVVDYSPTTTLGNIKVININNNNIEISTLTSIDISNTHLIDIFDYNNKVYVGIIKNSINSKYFELYEIQNKNKITTIEQIETDNNSTLYEDSISLAITKTTMYVSTDITLNYRNFGENSVSTTNISIDIQNLDFYNDQTNQFLIASTAENLHLLSVNETNFGDSICYITPIKASSIDIDSFNIYISSPINKTIKSYIITQDSEEFTIKESDILIASTNNSIGRFNNVSDLNIQGETLYISDTDNNRIQIIDEDKNCEIIDSFSHNTTPHSNLLDSHQNLYFVKTLSESQKTSSIVKYANTPDGYEELQSWQSQQLGLVSDTAISNNDDIYMIDYTNNRLVKLNNSTGIQPKYTFPFETSRNTKIEYIKKLDLFAILNEKTNRIYLLDAKKLDTIDSPIIDSITISNAIDITCTLDSIFVLENNKISLISISDNTMQISEKNLIDERFSEYSCIEYSVYDNYFYAFDNIRQCIVYFTSDISSMYFNIEGIDSETPIDKSNAPVAANIINDGIIYDLPYSIGNQYQDISNCIKIGSHDNYYKVIFEYNNALKVGFIDSRNATTINHVTTRKLRVITTNLKVPVYKYPTILKFDEKSIITSYIPINTFIDISYYEFPTSIDTKIFYAYESDGKIGYIFNADVILDDGKNIIPLHTNNSSINCLGKEDVVNIYSDDKSTILATLSHDERIYVENYDKNSEYTLVIFKTEDLNTITGYVKTEFIEMDELDNTKIILICIIILSVLMLITTFITYFIIKKKKNP